MHVQKQLPEVLYKKGVFKNSVKFTGKQLCHSIFFENKVKGLRLNFSKLRLFKNLFFTEHLRTTASAAVNGVYSWLVMR